MNKRWIWIGLIFVVLAFSWGVWRSKNQEDPSHKAEVTKAASYWTCPMHPQIHSDKPGECPICHMKLVEVKDQGTDDSKNNEAGDNRAPVVGSKYQFQLAGIQKHKVERMNLEVHIPVAGRFISSTAIAFQVYESDLRDIKPGLTFKGESSFHPENEVEGVVSQVDTLVDPTSRTVRVVGQVRKGPRGILSETSFSGDIEIDLKDRVAIPESSVLHTGKGALVYTIDQENKLTAKTVKLGLKGNTYYEVIEGLEAGDLISSGPNFLIDSEAKIRGVQ